MNKTLNIIVGLVLVGIMGFMAYMASTPQGLMPFETVKKWIFGDSEMEMFLNKVDRIYAETDLADQALFDAFVAEIASADSDFNAAKGNIDNAVSKLTGVKGTSGIAYMMLKDYLKKTAETEQHIRSVIDSNITSHCVNGESKICSALARLEEGLKSNRVQMNVSLLEMAEDMSNKGVVFDSESLRKLNEEINISANGVKVIDSKTAWASLGIVSTVVFDVAMGSVKTVIMPIIRGTLKKIGFSSILVVADGPLPIGDALFAIASAAFLAWDGYELYNAQVALKLPKKAYESYTEIRRSMSSGKS